MSHVHRAYGRAVPGFVVLAALVLAACGASSSSSSSSATSPSNAAAATSSTPTKADFIARADQICRTEALRDAALNRAVHSASASSALASALRQEQAQTQSEVAQLRTIPEPPADQPAITTLIGQISASGGVRGQMAAEAQRGDSAGLKAKAAQLNQLAAQYQTQSRAFGLHYCGQSTDSSDGSFATVLPPGFTDATGSVQGGAINVLFLAVGPRIDNETININVIREAARGRTDMNQIVQAELTGIKGLVPQANSFSPVASLSIDGAPARSLNYVGRPSGHLLRLRQVFVLHGGWIYTITYTALPATYEAHVGALDQVIAGWVWT